MRCQALDLKRRLQQQISPSSMGLTHWQAGIKNNLTTAPVSTTSPSAQSSGVFFTQPRRHKIKASPTPQRNSLSQRFRTSFGVCDLFDSLTFLNNQATALSERPQSPSCNRFTTPEIRPTRWRECLNSAFLLFPIWELVGLRLGRFFFFFLY